ncbi:hypothetical protein Abr02nite_42450 [Paractinoplanes brasiliensis]|nr:hypothetical protein Abr02nite_42450 [Actinoplanes brasiliensis]
MVSSAAEKAAWDAGSGAPAAGRLLTKTFSPHMAFLSTTGDGRRVRAGL